MVCPDASRAEAVGSVVPPWTLVGARWASSHSGRSFLMATEAFKPCWSSDCCCVYSAVHKEQHPRVQTSSRKCSGQLCLFLGICFNHFAGSAEQCCKKLDAQEQPQLCTKSLDFESLFTHFVYFEIVRSEWDSTCHPVDWAKSRPSALCSAGSNSVIPYKYALGMPMWAHLEGPLISYQGNFREKKQMPVSQMLQQSLLTANSQCVYPRSHQFPGTGKVKMTFLRTML